MKKYQSILLLCAVATCFLASCVSSKLLPQSADEVDFERAIEGKTGWSKYEEFARFEGVGRGEVFDAAKAGLGQAGFSLISARRDLGAVIGEHGMTAHDWNVVAGVYFRERQGGFDVKVVVEGSKDFGFSGDVTGDAWTSRILGGLRNSLQNLSRAYKPLAR